MQVLLAADSTVISADADAAQQVASAATAVTALAVSPNGQFVAALEASGDLRVWLADFSKCMSTFSLPEDSGPPKRMAWCGTDGVLLQWEVGLVACAVGAVDDVASWWMPVALHVCVD